MEVTNQVLFILKEISRSSRTKCGDSRSKEQVKAGLSYISVGSQTEGGDGPEELDSTEWSDEMTEELRRRYERLCQVAEESDFKMNDQGELCQENVEKQEIQNFVANFKKEFKDVLSDRVRCLKNFQYKIQLRDTTPVKFTPYPLPRHKEIELKKVIDQLIKVMFWKR